MARHLWIDHRTRATPVVIFGLVLPTLFLSSVLPFSVACYLFRLIRNRVWAGFASWGQPTVETILARNDLRHKNG
jgi:hypothetical protein